MIFYNTLWYFEIRCPVGLRAWVPNLKLSCDWLFLVMWAIPLCLVGKLWITWIPMYIWCFFRIQLALSEGECKLKPVLISITWSYKTGVVQIVKICRITNTEKCRIGGSSYLQKWIRIWKVSTGNKLGLSSRKKCFLPSVTLSTYPKKSHFLLWDCKPPWLQELSTTGTHIFFFFSTLFEQLIWPLYF